MSEQEQHQQQDQNETMIKDSNMANVSLSETPKTRRRDIVEVREKKGVLRAAIPRVKVPVAWAVLFFNVFLPGTGTLILACTALCGVPTDLPKQSRCFAFLMNFVSAILQIITAVVIVGWVWSVYWGMYAVTQATEIHDAHKREKKMAKELNEMEKKTQQPLTEENEGRESDFA